MIKHFTLFSVLLVTGCTAYITPDLSGQRKSITDIPLKQHNRSVDIYINGEKPREPFYKVKIIETEAYPGTSTDAMLAQLKQTAQSEGLDAVLLGDIGKQAGTVSIPSGNDVIASQKLTGIGIKYKSTIDYLDTILRSQSVSLWNDDNPEPKMFSLNYDFYGNNISLKDRLITRFFDEDIYPYEDMGSVLAPPAGWEYKYDSPRQVFSKRRVQGYGYLTCNFYYENGRLLKAEITEPDGEQVRKKKYLLEPEYNNAGMLTGRKLWKNKAKKKEMMWAEQVTYRLNGMPDKVKRYKITNGRMVLYFEMKNEYYTNAVLPQPEN
jgi:hypothetical protein